MKKLIAALAAAVVLTGCVKMGNSPPPDLPPYVQLYPGATTVMSVKLGELSSVAQQTTAKPADVLTYYRNQASSQGLTEQQVPPQSNSSPGQVQAAFGDAAGDKLLVVVVKPQSDGSMLSLTYKPAKPTT